MAILSYSEAVALKPSFADYEQGYIELLLAASAEWIESYLGTGAPTYDEPTAVSELITARGPLIRLSQPAAEILTVKERDITLDAEDYELRSGGWVVRRLRTGPYPYTHGWYGGIDITYVPLSNTSARELAQLELIELHLNNTPGVTSERIGEWSETFSQSRDEYMQSRDRILAGITGGVVGIY